MTHVSDQRGSGLAAVAVFGIVLVTLSWGLAGSPLAGTEGHRAVAAHQMLAGGDWLVPRLWGEPYLTKPPLHYWILAAAEGIAGPREWVWRFPSALGSALLGAILCLTAHRWFGRPAGLIAGLSFLGLVPIWSQGRSADVNSLNTLATVVAALCLLELGCRPSSRAPGEAAGPGACWWMVAGGVAVGASLLLKGPAGLPVIVGAIAGPVVANRDWAPLRRPQTWGALAIGVVVSGAWVATVSRALDVEPYRGWSGVRELGDRLSGVGSPGYVAVLTLPLVLGLYALPFSAALPLALHRSTTVALDVDARRRVRGVAGAVIAALVLGVLAGVSNPRYMYLVLPLLCPLAGAIGVTWNAEAGRSVRQWVVRKLMGTAAVGYAVVPPILVVLLWRKFDAFRPWLVAPAVISVGTGIWTIRSWHRQRDAAGAWGIVAMVLLLVFPVASYMNEVRRARSMYGAGLALREIIGDTRRVTAGNWVLNSPELFWYAGVDVDVRREGLSRPRDLRSPSWLVLEEGEWASWTGPMREPVDQVTFVPTRKRNAVVVRYEVQAGG